MYEGTAMKKSRLYILFMIKYLPLFSFVDFIPYNLQYISILLFTELMIMKEGALSGKYTEDLGKMKI